MCKFNKEVLSELKKGVLNGKYAIIAVNKNNTKKNLILVSNGLRNWEIYNGSAEYPISKAYDILDITQEEANNNNINYSMWNL